jgi:hypothetical protein
MPLPECPLEKTEPVHPEKASRTLIAALKLVGRNQNVRLVSRFTRRKFSHLDAQTRPERTARHGLAKNLFVNALKLRQREQFRQQPARDPAHAMLDPKALRRKAELEVIREFVTEGYPQGMVSIVSDTFDFWNVMTSIANELKAEILARKPDALGNAKVVSVPTRATR